MLLTDLGVFSWREGRWEPQPAGPQPFVPAIASRQTVFLSAEMVLNEGEASVTLLAGATKLLILRRTMVPLAVDIPAVDGHRASSLRLLASTADEWLVQGITFAGDARLGVFLAAISRKNATGALVSLKKGTLLPAFAGGFSVGDAIWLFPERQSEDQNMWVLQGGKWRLETPPSDQSRLLDATRDASGIWLAFSDGVLLIRGAERLWFPLTVALAENRWICEPPVVLASGVQGRWMRGAEPLGWGIGSKTPREDYPMDGASCSFFTNAAGVQGFAAPESVKISLTPAGSSPVTIK